MKQCIWKILKKTLNQSIIVLITTTIGNYKYLLDANTFNLVRICRLKHHICGPGANYFTFHTKSMEEKKILPHNVLLHCE